MKSFDVEDYLRRSSEEPQQKTSFGVTELPRAPAHGNFSDAAGALFRQNNIIVSALNDKLHRHNRFYADDPSFNPIEHIPAGHVKWASKYMDAKNKDDIRDIFFQIEDEIRDRELYADKPLESFFVGFIAANSDPTALLPGTLFYKNYYKRLDDLRRAVWVGGTLGSQATIQEAALLNTQKIRTVEESAENILATTVIGASIGAFSGKFVNSPEGRRSAKQTAQILEDGDITSPGVNPAPDGTPRPRPGGGGKGLAVAEKENIINKELSIIEGKSLPEVVFSEHIVNKLTDQQISDLAYDRAKETFPAIAKNLAQEIQEKLKSFESGELAEKIKIRDRYQKLDSYVKDHLKRLGDAALAFPDVKSAVEEIENLKSLVEKNLPSKKEIAELKKKYKDITSYPLSSKEFAQERHRHEQILRAENTEGGGGGNVPPNETSANFAAPEGKSVGAANVMESALQGQALRIGERTAKVLGVTLGKITPSGRMATNPLGYIRLAGQKIFENNWRYQKNYSITDEEGQERGFKPNAIALETLIKRDMGKATSLLMQMDNHYFNQSGIKENEKFKVEKDFFLGQGLSRDEFADAVFYTVHSGIEGENVDVNAAAKLWREFNDEYKEKYTELEVYPEGMTVRNSQNYMTHYYNVPWIQDPRNRPQAEQILTDNFKMVNSLVEENLPEIKAYIAANKKAKKLLKVQTKIEKTLARLKEKQESLSAQKIIDVALNEKIKVLEEELNAGTPEDIQKAIDKAQKLFKERMPEEIFDAEWKPRTIVLDDDQIWVSVQNTIDNIMNLNSQRFSNQYLGRMGIGNNPRPTNHRTLLVPTEQIAPMLVRDYRKVIPMFARSMIPNYHITKFAQDMGFDEGATETDVAGAAGQVIGGLMSLAREELDMRIRDATPEEAKKLYDAFSAGQADIKAGLELLLGTYGNGFNTNDGSFAKFTKLMAAYNYTRMMGYMVVSALTDPGAIILRNGYAGLHEGMVSIATHMKAAKYNKHLLQSIGKSTETFTGYRLKAYADQNDLVGAPGKVTKAFDYLTRAFGNLSLMSPYTDYMQHVTANAFIGELLRTTVGYAKKIKKLEKMQKTRDELLAQRIRDNDAIQAIEKEMAEFFPLPEETRSKYLASGLEDRHFKVLYDQWSKYGGIEDEVFWIDWGAWELNTKEKINVLGDIQASIIKDIDSTIIIPGLGDKPLFAHTDIGTIMLQFKGFSFGSTSRIAMSGLTHRDANFYNGIMAMLFLGGMGYIITSLLKGKEIDTSIENMAFEAIDRSGLLGILMEVPLIAQKMGFLPGMGTSRYQSRDWVGALGGPTLGTLSDWVALANKYKNADEVPLTLSDSNKTWRQFPLNNLWWIDGLNRNFGITDELALSLGFEDNR